MYVTSEAYISQQHSNKNKQLVNVKVSTFANSDVYTRQTQRCIKTSVGRRLGIISYHIIVLKRQNHLKVGTNKPQLSQDAVSIR